MRPAYRQELTPTSFLERAGQAHAERVVAASAAVIAIPHDEWGEVTSTGEIQKYVLREREWSSKGRRIN